ncbi:FecR family protein [Gynurincola endophyticus]|uniref:FecR family protein n=1 Tax=Gynurincola endophyticus TaxID=2479004 RepID=UPI000F8CA920|nr:FecR family protein [Gynurincola endophyticus]
MQVERIWLLIARKLSDEASMEELKELDMLIRQYPDSHFSLEVFNRLWEKDEEVDPADLEDAYARHLNRMAEKGIHFSNGSDDTSYMIEQAPRRTGFRWLIAASFAAIITVAGWWLLREPKQTTVLAAVTAMNEITTPNGSKSQLRLPDSTVVWLNAGSKLTYPKEFGKDIREVTLVGEAYFDVKKKNNMPFIIHTHRMDIKVLGTTFNVKSYPGEPTTEASLIKGSIEVLLKDRESAPILLKPWEKIVVREFSSATVSSQKNNAAIKEDIKEPEVAIKPLGYDETNDAVLETAWVENVLVFNEMNFSEVTKLMERWYGIKIQIQNPALFKQQLTGSFKNETLDQALQALQFVVDFDYERTSPRLIIIK